VLTVCPGLMRTGSHVNALFSGDASREYRWFSLLASLPGFSVSAQYAAKRIVRAVLRQEAEIAISPQAVIASRVAPMMPSLTTRAMAAASRFLPESTNGGEESYKGRQIDDRELRPATVLGAVAAERYNEAT
jgi:short-subunit dehydrogenase